MNEEIRKLRETVKTVFCLEKEKKICSLEKYRGSMGEYENAGEAAAATPKDSSNPSHLQQRQSRQNADQDTVDQIKQILVLSQDMAQANFDVSTQCPPFCMIS